MIFKDNAQILNGNKTLQTPDKVIHYYDIVKIEKYHGLGYEEGADRIATVMQSPQLRLNTDLLIDGTGIGDAVVELVRKRNLFPIPIIFSGGKAPVEHYAEFGSVFKGQNNTLTGVQIVENISVPKKDLVDAGKVMLQQGRLRTAPGKWNEEFKKQLQGFKGKLNEKTKNTIYEAETETLHDDLVVVFLMGAWWIKNRREKGIKEQTSNENTSAGWEPDDYM